MTNRNLHIAYVSQISRTIGKYLGLNTELIEAIALGHDLGHAPSGMMVKKARAMPVVLTMELGISSQYRKLAHR